MKKLNIILVSLLLSLAVEMPSDAANDGVYGMDDKEMLTRFREAMRLYDKGMLNRAQKLFDQLAVETGEAGPEGFSVLCDVRANVTGYIGRMESFVASHPYSALIPQLKYHHALNLFEAGDYAGASDVFSDIDEKSLYRSQRTEYVFRSAYCNLENGNIHSARQGFAAVVERNHSDFMAPSKYGIGYVEYQLKHFADAVPWFEAAAKDARFRDMADYYILECRFMQKNYDYVIRKGGEMYVKVPSDRKPHLARIISESYLVLGDVTNARRYYDMAVTGGKLENTRADWFYSGSVLYAAGDYKDAIDNFERMGERRDSIGQIASYNLGYCYIQTKDKVSAMRSFKEASGLNFDSVISEDALFNYAKLAFDLNNDISAFNEYMRRYPTSGRGDRIYSYIAVAALNAHDYAGAVNAYDRIDELDKDMRLNYMKANYLRAHQLVENGSYRKAIPCLKAASYYSPRNSRFNQLARFWLAESYYRNDKYADARAIYTELYNGSALYGQPEGYLIPYNIAYCFFKEGNYAHARKWFGEYLGEKSVVFRKEALVRKADCDFVVKNYKSAAAAYDMVIRDYFDVNDIYPYYQAALSYGLSENHERKIILLSHVLKASPDAEFYAEALFELGRSYAVREDDDNAGKCFDRIVESVKDSTYVAKAYIELGTIARNQSMYNEALSHYKTVLEKMPLSEYADDALLAIESIYQTKNNAAEYIAYIDSIGRGSVKTEDEKEDMIFNSAEQVYLSENYQKALVALESYMEKYPQGRNVYKADFYMAESYRNLGKAEQACDCYKKVMVSGEGAFVELSMLNFARLSYLLERWEDAYAGYKLLLDNARLENNVYTARIGMMRSAFKGHEWYKAVDAVEALESDSRADKGIMEEAEYVKAKSYLAVSRRDEAMEILRKLSGDVMGNYGAEAAYMLIQDSYDRGDFEQVETKVYAFSDAGSAQTYWLAKSFIVLGDSFMERNEKEQAKATFESIREGYRPSGAEDDVLDNVNMRLKRIEEMEKEQQNR